MVVDGDALFGELHGTAHARAVFAVPERLRAMLAVEAALARAQARCGVIPAAAAAAIGAAADDAFAGAEAAADRGGRLDVEAIVAGTERTGQPVVPLTRELARLAGPDAGRYVHWGATTQDVVDTATVLQLRAALGPLEDDLAAAIAALARRAAAHRDDVMAGRTFMQHALPITFGYVCAQWLAPLPAALDRLRAARERVLQVQFGGAAGTLASLGDRGRAVALALGEELGLRVPAAPWHADRSAFAELACALALACGSLAKIATDVALLMQTEIGEVAEPHAPGRGGSSAMPHKRNPIACEYVIAAARAVHALVPLMLGALAGDHQRSTGPWQSEDLALPRIVVLASAAFAQARTLAEGMTADVARMRRNLDLTGGLIVSEAVSLALAEHVGSPRAHAAVEHAAARVLDDGVPLLDALLAQDDVRAHFDSPALTRLLDSARYTGEAGAVVDRVLATLTPSLQKELP